MTQLRILSGREMTTPQPNGRPRPRPSLRFLDYDDDDEDDVPYRIGARYCPVKLREHLAISSGVPCTTISPPASPPSGPKSIIQSAVLMTSRLCSMTSRVFPEARSLKSTSSSLATSW